ncbi:MAG: YdcF family protein [Rickettsia conorii subsp. raoultii]|uniref:YdcF family protein n=1 Tax=Rickettsia conorii TaxID=781 RepID=UPI003AF0F713
MIRKFLLTIFALWVGGFGYYLYLINSYKLNSNTTNAIIVFAGGGHKIETGIAALLKVGYAPILFITGIESTEQLKNLLKERNVIEQQVILAPNKIMSEEDNIKKAVDFIVTYNLTSIILVEHNYNMPFMLNKLEKAISSSNNIYIVPYPVFSKQKYDVLLKSYHHYLMSILV